MTKTKTEAAEWPKDPTETVWFDDLAQPVVKAIRFAYNLRRRNRDKDIPWRGLPIGKSARATCLDNEEQLTAEHMRYDEDDQGRDALEVLVGVAIRLGIEQGRRVQRRQGSLPGAPDATLWSKKEDEPDDVQRGRVLAKLLIRFEMRDVEDGMDHDGTDILRHVIASHPKGRDWVRSFCTGDAGGLGRDGSFAASILTCLGRIPRRELGSKWTAELLRDVLKSNRFRVRDAAVAAAEHWGGWDVVQALKEHEEPTQWLRIYIGEVLRGMR